jgi:hypothetical protein
MLVDAGPLVALIDADDADHLSCRRALARIRPPLITTWPAFTEAMHLALAGAGWRAQASMWRMVDRALLELRNLSGAEIDRARSLMEKYRDLPMDLADATLVATAETLRQRRIFTLDADFRVYRLHGREPFEIVP